MEFDLDCHRIYIDCPQCNFSTRVFLRQVRNREVVICGGCKANIFLIDHLGSYTKARREIYRAIDDLTDSLRDLNLTIRL